MSNKPIKPEELNVNSPLIDKVNNFRNLLDSINSLDNKKKQLWKEIYENAITDRQAAYILYTQLLVMVHGKSTEHAIHGPNIAKYLERMSKANDQLIKLAEMLTAAQEQDEKVDPDSLFEQIAKNKK